MIKKYENFLVQNTLASQVNEKLISNDFIYHGTSKGAALRIQIEGFMNTYNTGDEKPSISFSNDIDYAKYYAKVKGGSKDRMVILRTKLDNRFKISTKILKNKGAEYVTFQKIPLSELEILTPDGSWKPLDKWDVIFNEPLNENQEQDYIKWKKDNVTYRGMKEMGKANSNASGVLGRGLYTTPNSNKKMSKDYGDIYFVVNAKPKHPKIFNDLNQWELWFYNSLVFPFSQSKGKSFPDLRDFNENTTIEDELLKLGYDGVEIKGRELVNYTPENIRYFKTENELKNYFFSITSQ
jgi:hypothetical protein